MFYEKNVNSSNNCNSIDFIIPNQTTIKDGGTVEYKALLYKVSKVNRLISIEEMEQAGKVKDYDKGIIVEILGFEIFNNVE